MDDIEFRRIESSRETKGQHSWEYSHDETWECDEPFDDGLAQRLIEQHLSCFPVVRATYTLNPDDPKRITVRVVEDNCM